MEIDIKKFAFLYGDCEYFQWFAKKTKENLKNVVKWKRLRRGNPNIDTIWSEQKQDLDENAIMNLKFGIVTRAFLLHLKWPIKYPIFDINVFRAMKKIRGEMPKDKTIYIKDKEDYRRYREFFNQYFQDNEKEIANMNLPILMDVDREIIKRRVLDRALWEFGKQISNAELCHINYLHQP